MLFQLHYDHYQYQLLSFKNRIYSLFKHKPKLRFCLFESSTQNRKILGTQAITCTFSPTSHLSSQNKTFYWRRRVAEGDINTTNNELFYATYQFILVKSKEVKTFTQWNDPLGVVETRNGPLILVIFSPFIVWRGVIFLR